MTLPLRPPFPSSRRPFVLFGGPRDGEPFVGVEPPDGYNNTGGILAVWHAINVKLVWPERP